jgi:tRNA pseudouridine32 synthase/23S rRNA pseudouridine746 synthase
VSFCQTLVLLQTSTINPLYDNSTQECSKFMDRYTHHIPPPCTEDVKILHRDDHILVLSKPAGLLSVPGRIVKDSVLRRVQVEFPKAVIVHRLDLDTSGLLVLALTHHAVRELNRYFRERTIAKEYMAEVFGVIEHDMGVIALPIAPDWERRPRQRIDREVGKDSCTRFYVQSRNTASTTLLLKPVTGRSHQLRIHLSSIDHPILGCDLYAHEEALVASTRLRLHASYLAFEHPFSKEKVNFEDAISF